MSSSIIARVSKQSGIDTSELTVLDKNLNLKSNQSTNIVFGPLSSCYITYHDIVITPSTPESFVTIKVNLDSFRTEFTTNQPISIVQRACEPYPSFELKLNSVTMHKKKYFYEGVISVSGGACEIVKVDQMLVDH